MGEPCLRVEDLRVSHAGVEAVRGLRLEIRPGEVVALLGPNGAGKTSALNAIAGLVPSESGTVHLAGRDVTGRPADARARAGLALVPDDRGLFSELSVADHLWLAAHGRPRPAELEEVNRLFPTLTERRGQRAGTLSGGEAQMLSIAVALLGRPTVLLIDELSFGLAPSIVGPLLGRCRQLADERGLGIVLVEQFVDLALGVADRALVLRSGRVVLEGDAKELSSERHRVRDAYLGTALAPR